MSAKSPNSMQVCIRLRPCVPGESSLWKVKDGCSIQLAEGRVEPHVLDYIFDEEASNREIFDQMGQHIVRACLLGLNGTILTYGQKFSGKTYTMMGDFQDPGVMELSAKYIFQQIDNETERHFDVYASYIEIYNDKVNDLLNKRNQDLKLHDGSDSIVMVKSERCCINNDHDLMRIICQGNKERSGRSHAILRVFIESYADDRINCRLHGILSLVDLAGAERLSMVDSPSGSRVTGGVHINKSLMFLSNVVKHLADKKYISFRESKLTHFLQASLSDKAFTTIICTIRPWLLEESQSTLNFAMHARKIRTNNSELGIRINDPDISIMERQDWENKEQSQDKEEEIEISSGQLDLPDITTTGAKYEAPKTLLPDIPDQSSQLRCSKWPPMLAYNFNNPKTDTDVAQPFANQPMETFQENDLAPREESQAITEYVVNTVNQELPEPHDYILQQVASLSDALQLIDINIQSNFTRLFDTIELSETQKLGIAATSHEQIMRYSEYEDQIEELMVLLTKAKEDLIIAEQIKSDEINALKLECLQKVEKIERESRAKYRAYTLEWHANKEQLLRSGEELSKVTDFCHAEIEEFKEVYNRRIQEELKDSKAELEECINIVKEKLILAEEHNKQRDVMHSTELEGLRADLQAQIKEAEDGRIRASDELALCQEEYTRYKDESLAKLEALDNEHIDLMASWGEQMDVIQLKYDQLNERTSSLKEEKLILLDRIDEVNARHSNKVHELKRQLDAVSQQKEREKSDFEEKLESMTADIGGLKDELDNARRHEASHDHLIEEIDNLKLYLSEVDEESSTLQLKNDVLQAKLLDSQNRISAQNLEAEKLQADLENALEAKDIASAELSARTSQLDALTYQMSRQAEEFEQDLADLNNLITELRESNQSNQLQVDNHNLRLKNQLEQEQKLGADLRTELEETKARLEEQLRNQEAEANRKLMKMKQHEENSRQHIGELVEECDNLRCLLKTQTNSFKTEKEFLDSSVSNLSKDIQLLEEKNVILKQNQCRNEEIIDQLRANMVESDFWRKDATNQKIVAEAANNKCRQLKEQIEELQASLKCKKAFIRNERSSMAATISSLLDDKRNLEEKQCTLYEKIAKLEDELSALQAIIVNQCSSPTESINRSNSRAELSPVRSCTPPTNLATEPRVGGGPLRKSSRIKCAARREMRKASHDEHRMQLGLRDLGESIEESAEAQGPAEEQSSPNQEDPSSQH